MVTAHPQIRVKFAPQERARHGVATISIQHSRAKTGAAEFGLARGRLGRLRAVGAQLQWRRR